MSCEGREASERSGLLMEFGSAQRSSRQMRQREEQVRMHVGHLGSYKVFAEQAAQVAECLL